MAGDEGGSAVKRTASGRVDDDNNGACDSNVWGFLCITIPSSVAYLLACKCIGDGADSGKGETSESKPWGCSGHE